MLSNPPLRVLSLDTSSTRASLALLEGNELRAELRLQARRTHSTVLLASIDFLLHRLDWNLRDLNLIAVGIGPGSFTGIRIGMATAMGIAQSLAVPLAGISGFDALAHQIKDINGRLAVILDAQRGQAFYAEYEAQKGRMKMVTKPKLVSCLELDNILAKGHLYVTGDVEACGIQITGNQLKHRSIILATDRFLAPTIGRLALRRKRSWHSGDYLKCEPLYVRLPDALKNRTRKDS